MNLMNTLLEIGLTLSTDGESLVVVPASELTDPLRALIRENKAHLLAAVREAEHGAADLVGSIKRCCAARGDTDANRDALIAEATDLTLQQKVEMTAHFNEQAAIWATATGQGAA